METNANKLIDDMVASLNDWRGPAFANVRRIILEAVPGITEEWKWRGTPVWSHDGVICIAKAFKDKVKVTFYNGAHLPDPDKVFNSDLDGNQWRALDIFRDDKVNEKALKSLVKAAAEYNHAKAKPAKKKPAK